MEELPTETFTNVQCRPLASSTLTPEDLKRAEIELNETEENKERCLKTLRDMLKDEPDLVPRTDDAFLIRFLRVRKYDCDRAFQLIKKYYTAHATYPVFQNFLPQTARKVLAENRHMFLPHRDPEGRAIFVLRIGMTEPSQEQFQEGFRTVMLSMEKILQDEGTQINGIVGIADFRGFRMAHVRHLFSARNANCSSSVMQDCLPGRFKALHTIYEPWFMDFAFALVRPFLTEKSKRRMYFHGSSTASLHRYLPPSILPEEYGGELGPFDNTDWSQQLMASEDSFLYNQKFGYLNRRS